VRAARLDPQSRAAAAAHIPDTARGHTDSGTTSITWLDRGAQGDLTMELNGGSSPQTLRHDGASARSARVGAHLRPHHGRAALTIQAPSLYSV